MNMHRADVPTPAVTGSPRGLHIFACILVVLTVGLIAAGAMVTSTGSGLSVPDWPTTYGENMFLFHPSKWVGGIFYEHGHRLFASTVGFLTIVLAVYAQFGRARKAIRILSWSALAAVISQGILGGMTVKFLLPTWISVFHACLAQTFLCLLVTIAVLTHRRYGPATASNESNLAGKRSVAPLLLVGIIFAQLILGAVMRHTHSGIAVPDFPLAYGRVLPSLSDDALTRYNDVRAFDYLLPPVTRGQIAAHLAHRAGAVVVVLFTIVALVAAFRGRDGESRRAVLMVVALVGVQIALGAYSIWTLRSPLVATAHVAVGAMTLGTAWRCFLVSRRSVVDGSRAADSHAVTTELAGAVA